MNSFSWSKSLHSLFNAPNMKKMMFFVLLPFCAAISYSQKTSHSLQPPISFFLSHRLTTFPPSTRDEYLRRSDNQHRAGLVLLIGGGTLFVGGAIWGASTLDDWGESTDDTPGYVLSAGILSMLGSIPLFVASHRNAKKERHMDASFKIEKGPRGQVGGIRSCPIPGMSVNISF